MTPYVLDIYHGDTVSDFSRIKAAGIVGVIHKASQGTNITDKLYATRRKQALAVGLLWGAYHYMSLDDPTEQAEFFLSAAAPDDSTLLSLDWENTSSGAYPSVGNARVFLEDVANKMNRKAV